MNIQPCRLRVQVLDGDRVVLFTESLRDPQIHLNTLGKVRVDSYIYDKFGPGFIFYPDAGSRHGWFISWINLHSPATNWSVLRWESDNLLVSPIKLWDGIDPLPTIGQIVGFPDEIKGVFRSWR